MPEEQERATPLLIGDLVTHVTELVRKEIQLFRAETEEKATQVMVAVGSLAAALAIALTALNVLAAALVAAITDAGLNASWSAIIVGVVFAIIAYVLANRGMSNLKATSLAPRRTVRATTRDAEMVKGKM
ncbi:phage holin family protein [Amaricoccus solimangrovi]|uniref:Phage holin family protein n=1 Tax=Amaricoccus solimangrovi TaxID=2589815 RepID=A0A501WTF2_9RHOB|nr:phage holin family protein [Amaricoccus solimangrovi]TPE51670.1 phage holin family protein [Amaricoccus solimangrovi]